MCEPGVLRMQRTTCHAQVTENFCIGSEMPFAWVHPFLGGPEEMRQVAHVAEPCWRNHTDIVPM
jgi:hypothetical protein